MDYFSSEDMPLLGDFLSRAIGDTKGYPRLHHGQSEGRFEVADFPETPLLPECSDDEFSDFVESPGSEVPPVLDTETPSLDSSEAKLTDLPTAEYIQHVAIIVLVQLLIPIPFMLPMGINFARRAIKVFLPGFVLGIAGHTLFHLFIRLADVAPIHHLQSLADPHLVLSAFYAQLKIGIVGGFVVGAILSHVLNFCILAHTICRLVRGLEPQPKAMRRAMDSSRVFQFLQRLFLDLITGAAMFPVGAAVRDWFYGAQVTHTGGWHTAASGAIGALAVQLYIATRPAPVPTIRPFSASKKYD